MCRAVVRVFQEQLQADDGAWAWSAVESRTSTSVPAYLEYITRSPSFTSIGIFLPAWHPGSTTGWPRTARGGSAGADAGRATRELTDFPVQGLELSQEKRSKRALAFQPSPTEITVPAVGLEVAELRGGARVSACMPI